MATSGYGNVSPKSVHTSAQCSKEGEYIFKILKDVILEIGPSNVVQVCMDNATNCVAIRRMIGREWPMNFLLDAHVTTLICSMKILENVLGYMMF